MAEWLNAPVLKTGIPKGIVSSNLTASVVAQVAELADAHDLGSCGFYRGGSSPSLGTY